MPLASGTRLGPYEILAPLGAGGMGEVYRARDMRLERIVAVKILPSHLSDDSKLRERFEQEAKAIGVGDSFHADKPQLWSPGQFTDRGVGSGNFDLHPDGKRFAVLKAPATGETPPVNKVSFLFHFFDELRRKVPPGKN